MAFVFGETLICDDAVSAKAVTFSPQIPGGVRSVTVDGDVYDPSGTLSGGAAPNSSGVLVKVQELLDKEGKVREAGDRLKAEETREAKEREGREKWRALVRELDVKEHECKLAEEQVGGSRAAHVRVHLEFRLFFVFMRLIGFPV